MFKELHSGLVAVAMHHIVRNDTPHRTDHIAQVAKNSRAIAANYGLDPVPMLLASLLHDIYSGRSRTHHHTLSSTWAAHYLPLYGYLEPVVRNVAFMCKEHRDSGNGQYNSVLSEAFAAADRGPLVLEESVARSLGKSLNTVSHDELAVRLPGILEHLRNKFSKNGYACHNAIHEDFYKTENDFFRSLISLPDIEVLAYLTNRDNLTCRTLVPDAIAYSGLYILSDGTIAKYNSASETFIVDSKYIPAYQVTNIVGMVQLNTNYFGD